jgi:hypothetical protein
MQNMGFGPDGGFWEIIVFLIIICVIFRFVYLLTQPFECCYRKIAAMNSNRDGGVITEIVSINDLHHQNGVIPEIVSINDLHHENGVIPEIVSINDLHDQNNDILETTATIINVPIVNYENKNEIISSDLPIADIV